jgi:8-oxo-dGTP diphosphatase
MPTYKYPRPMLTVDIAVFQQAADLLQVMLIQRRDQPFKDQWALPGGFIDMEETLEESAARELNEETGLVISGLEQVHTYGHPQRDPRGRVISIAFTILLSPGTEQRPRSGSDARAARWFPVTDLPGLAFDHLQIIQDAHDHIKDRVE